MEPLEHIENIQNKNDRDSIPEMDEMLSETINQLERFCKVTKKFYFQMSPMINKRILISDSIT